MCCTLVKSCSLLKNLLLLHARFVNPQKKQEQQSIMTKGNINNVKRVLSTMVEQIIHITGSNNINTYKLFFDTVSFNM